MGSQQSRYVEKKTGHCQLPGILRHAPIQTKKEIDNSTGDEREKILQALFESYLTTVDEYNSLKQQPYYEIGSEVESWSLSAQADSTTRLYDIRVRDALQRIMRESVLPGSTRQKAVQ